MTATYQYDAFGAVKTKTGIGDSDWRFTGEQQGAQTARGLYYLRARYYDPALGRFTRRDPFWGFVAGPQSQNRYIYNGNDPVNLVDPYGLCGLRSLGDVADCGKDAVDKVGEGAQKVGEGAQAVGGAVGGVVSGTVDAFTTGYVDVGVTGCLPVVGPVGPCLTGGAQFGWGQGFHPYVGGGVGTGGIGLSANLYPDQRIVEGLSCGVSGGVPLWPVPGVVGIGPGGDFGYAGIGNKEGGFYGGGGVYIGTTGVSATCIYVFGSLF